MRTALTLMLAAVLLCPLAAYGTIINIPDDYPTIQEGIDHGQDGDTVLVQPDTYYENLNFNGHNVVLASLFLTTGDTGYISSTIIDGHQASTVVTFESYEDSTAHLVGFTIQNGFADEGGGVLCIDYCSPTISNNIISGNSGLYYGGGIGCSYYSSPTVSNNTIRDNSSAYGGGVSCELYSDPMISDNTFSGNSASYGGGIYCHRSSPAIINNSISENSAPHGGGGIYCVDRSSPTISGNSISGNSAYGGGSGGGIYCAENSSPTISDNAITGNRADDDGGGIYCGSDCSSAISSNNVSDNWTSNLGYGGGICCRYRSSPTIQGNLIAGNRSKHGGGVYCGDCSAVICGNTIRGNSSGGWGGGVYCRYFGPTVTNSILWGDTAPNGPEIYVESGEPLIRYCDVQGGWQGQGNIDGDPLFVGPERDDFHLRWRSPCIDAGDPNLPPDPDGTRSDMGAFCFDQDLLAVVEVYPHDSPVVIPPEGGEISYDGWIFNLFEYNLTVDVRSYVYIPGIGRPSRLDRRNNITIAPGDSVGEIDIMRAVPGGAPAGDYTFVAYLGDYPTRNMVDSCYFYFTKTGSIAGGATDWPEGEVWFKESGSTEGILPSDYALFQNHPNPFNATTTLRYQVPKDAYVKLEIYNSLGQKVATLVDEKQVAGYKSVTWDASDLCSGICFCKLSSGDYTETKRMMLMK
jgi:parallel beta-helix repeat protein/predicted outer membrane repeat protein